MIQSLDRTRTGKSIPIALAFAWRACVRSCDRVKIRLWLGWPDKICRVVRRPAGRSGAVPGPVLVVFRIHVFRF